MDTVTPEPVREMVNILTCGPELHFLAIPFMPLPYVRKRSPTNHGRVMAHMDGVHLHDEPHHTVTPVNRLQRNILRLFSRRCDIHLTVKRMIGRIDIRLPRQRLADGIIDDR